MSSNRPVLLVEDNPDDVFLMQRAWKGARVGFALQVVPDGQQAIHYLAGQGKFQDRSNFPLPCLILLDLKLPYMSGIEVLRWIRQQETLRTLLVVILTSSSETLDIDQSYRHGANSYLVKPSESQKLLDLVADLNRYWLGQNTPPSVCR